MIDKLYILWNDRTNDFSVCGLNDELSVFTIESDAKGNCGDKAEKMSYKTILADDLRELAERSK